MSVTSAAPPRSAFLYQLQGLWRYHNFGLLWSGQGCLARPHVTARLRAMTELE